MLSHAKQPKSYWAKAMYTVVYLINRSPSVPLKGDVPQRVWTGKDVSYQHLRVFGCLAYMHVPKDQRSKLDNKSKACIFMGYSEDEFGYRLWDLVDKKVVRSRDVVFLEDKTIEDWKQQKSEPTPQSTSTTIDLRPSESSPRDVRRLLADRAEFKSIDSERPIDEYELELSNLDRPID